jgi:required for meiotic nuclear division protein 1
MKTYRITAINTAENIDFINFRPSVGGNLISYSNSELFFRVSEDQYISIFQNGVVVFTNYTQSEISAFLSSVQGYMVNPQNQTSETVELLLTDTKNVYSENSIIYIPMEFDNQNLIKLMMNDVVQILGIDFYSKITEKLLGEIKTFAAILEKKGRIILSKKDRNKFIGSCLSTKNRIAENLYIFDTPDIVWGDESLEKVHNVLMATYNLKPKLKELEYTLTVINENLQIFMEIFEHTRASTLEIVVILLIMIEILNSLTEKFHIF